MNNIKMLYDKIYISEGIEVNKTVKSKESNICHYLYFLSKGFKTLPNVSNGCPDLLMISMNLSNIAIWNIKGSDYCCINSGINKSEATNLLQNIDLTNKSGTL